MVLLAHSTELPSTRVSNPTGLGALLDNQANELGYKKGGGLTFAHSECSHQHLTPKKSCVDR
jgi:hypothetical protein